MVTRLLSVDSTQDGPLAVPSESFRKQRTVNPLIVPAGYNFLYSSSRPSSAGSTLGGA
jgi:hypothetical protein